MSTVPAPARATRVLLVCESLRVTGGVERFVCQLGNELVARGMTVAIGNVDAERDDVVYRLDPRVEVVSAGVALPSQDRGAESRLGLLRTRWRVGRALGRVVDAEPADVVVLNGLVTACSLLAVRPGIAPRSICCDHNHFAARSRLWRWLRARFYPRVAAVVSLSAADAPRFAALNANTDVIANASALTATAPAQPVAGRVLAVGRHQAQKGFDLLLRAWTRVVAAVPSARLRIVGAGPLGDALAQQASELGIAASVDWTAPTESIEPLYREAALFVLSSRYEGMPLALLEAQALGVPAVAFDCPTGPREILAGDTGIVVAAGDTTALAEAIVALLRDEPRRARMAVAAIARSQALFSLRRHVDAWATLIDEVAARGREGEAGMSDAGRTASVIVPCRNERAHLEPFVASVLAQRLPAGWQLEVIVADGASDDGTFELLVRLAATDARLRVVANPARIVSTGLNLALAEARGEIVVRMDVHTTYAPDYVIECIAALARTQADNVGGPWRAEVDAGAGAMQEAVAAAFQSPIVAGGALSRRLDHEGPVDTVYLGAWPRATFTRFGTFDEALVRNQDDEHNLRIVAGGGTVWQSARIKSAYRPRARLAQVFRQYLQYGYWKPFVMKKHGQPAALRHLVPALLVLALLLGAALAIGSAVATGRTLAWPLLVIFGAYASIVIAMTAAVAAAASPRLAALARVPVVIAASHLGYGLGSLAGWLDVVRGRRGGARFTALTR